MELTIKNILKAIIFYTTVIMGVLTVGLDYDHTPFTNTLIWFAVLAVLGFTTYNMCNGKTNAEIKKFTGIDFSED